MFDQKSYWIGVSVAAVSILVISTVTNAIMERKMVYVPTTTNIEEGYVVPGNLELKCQDQNKNGFNETIVEYDGKHFLLRYDGNKITGTQYEIDLDDVLTK